MKRAAYILAIFLVLGVRASAQQYEFNVVLDYPSNTSYSVSKELYSLVSPTGGGLQSTGNFIIDNIPTKITINFDIVENIGLGTAKVCGEIWETLLPASTTCYSLQSLNNQDCTPGTQTYNVYYSLKPILSFEAGTTPQFGEISSVPICTTDSVRLVGSPGFNTYQWQYSFDKINWIDAPILSGNEVSFTFAELLGSSANDHLNETTFFRYTVDNCTDSWSATPLGYQFSISQPSLTSLQTGQVSCAGGNNGWATVALDRSLLLVENVEFALFKLVTETGDAILAEVNSSGVFNDLSTGTYYISLQTSGFKYCNSVSSKVSFTIDEPAPLDFTTTLTQPVICFDSKTAELSIVANGGTPGYEYAIDDSLAYTSSSVLDSVGAGPHRVYVRDNNLCVAMQDIVIVNPSPIDATISTTTLPSCPDKADGSITIIATGGWGDYQYSDSASGLFTSSPVFDNLAPGPASFWILDSAGCKIRKDTVIASPAPIQINDIIIAPPDCSGGIASMTIGAIGGTGILQFALDTTAFQSTNVFDIPAGLYAVYVRDDNLCRVDSVGIVVTDTPPISYQTLVTPVSCFDGSDGVLEIVNITNGTAPYTYSFDDGANFDTLSTYYNIRPDTTYYLAVKDSLGCISSTSVTVDKPQQITGTITETPIDCNGANTGSLQIAGSGGTGELSYFWFNGDTTDIVNNLAAGTYNVKIFDENGCESNLIEYVLSEPDEILITPVRVNNNGYDLSCFGDTDAVVDLLVTGGTVLTDYTFLWSNGQTTSTLTNVGAGSFSVEVTDSNNCLATATIDVTAPPELIFAEVLPVSVSCNGVADGSLTVSASGGVGGYLFTLDNGTFVSDTVFTSLAGGMHTVAVQDLNNCQTSETIIIPEPDLIDIQLESSQNTLCGQANGAINVLVSGGVLPYSFTWQNAAGTTLGTSQNLVDVVGGSYTLTVTDANGCTSQSSFVVSDSDGPQISVVSVSGITCFGGNDGSATIQITGGVSPYTVFWQDGTSALAINSLPAGPVNVQVTDVNGCTSFLTIDIPTNPEITLANSIITPPLCNGEATGSIQVMATGGIAPYSYSWSTGASGASLSGLPAGDVELTITDSVGCQITETLTVTEPDELTLDFLVTTPGCVNTNNGSVQINVYGGTPPFIYSFNNQPTSALVQNLAPGAYPVEVVDANNCSLSAVVEVPEAQPVVLNMDDLVICDGQEVEIVAPVTATSYEWYKNNTLISTADKILVSSAGEYLLKTIDASGCQAEGSFVVTTSSDVLNGDFLMSSTAYVGDTVIIIDITFPLPDSSNWILPEAASVVDLTNDFVMLVFSQSGVYEIGFEAYLGQCYDYYTSTIEIIDKADEVNGRIVDREDNIIDKVSVFPNPNNGVFSVEGELFKASRVTVSIINLSTNQFISKKISEEAFSHKTDFTLWGISPGNYAIVFSAGDERRVIRLIIQ